MQQRGFCRQSEPQQLRDKFSKAVLNAIIIESAVIKMSKVSVIILAIISAILIVFLAGIYYFIISSQNKNYQPQETTNNEESEVLTQEQQMAQIRKDYPETITGVINFLDAKDFYKTIIKTSAGKEYALYPVQQKSVYESIGIKNGQRVEIWARFKDQENLEWGIIK